MELDMRLIEEIKTYIEQGSVSELQEKLVFITLESPGILNKSIPKYGMSLFHLSVGFSKNDTRVVKVLMDHGADPNNADCADKATPLHISIYEELDVVLDFLLKHGGDPFIQDGDGKNCYDLVEAMAEPDIFKSILVRHTSFSALSSISSEGSCGTSVDTGMSYMTCLTSCSDPEGIQAGGRMTSFFTDDEDEISVAEPKKNRRYGFLSTIREETSSVMHAWNRISHNSTNRTTNSTALPVQIEEREDLSLSSVPEILPPAEDLPRMPEERCASPPSSKSNKQPPPSPEKIPTTTASRPIDVNLKKPPPSSISSSPTHSVASTPSEPPSPTLSEMDRLQAKMTNLNMNIPVTPTTYHTIAKFFSPYTNQLTLTPAEHQYSSELLAAIQDLSIIDRLKYGDLKIEVARDAASDSPKRNGKSYYNYVLLDPKVIKRINLSGDQLKSDVIKNSEKFRKFISAIFYIGKGCGKRPIKHLEDAKIVLMSKGHPGNDKIKRILDIWKSGQGVIIHSFYHHSPEREANVNEAAMIDAMGVQELSNLKKGSYSGETVGTWNQKQKNQFGVFLLRTCFSLYAVNGTIKEIFPHDV